AAAPAGAEPWQRVEAVRWALFTSAAKDVPDRQTYFGQGLLRAHAALDVPFRADLPKTPADTVSFPWLRLLGIVDAVAAPPPVGGELMYEVEALQVFLQTPGLEQLAGGADPQTDPLSPADRKKVIAALRASPLASKALREHLGKVYRAM
ncbi:MAG: hypothetical protein J2P46_10505, partial [Zavarzinella sp.]|nr:hypothetical protein [Zavarzinella sp.]